MNIFNTLQVPEGVVRRQHWIRVLEEEEKLRAKQGIAALSYVPKLTRTHIFPDGFERMNVKMAYKVREFWCTILLELFPLAIG